MLIRQVNNKNGGKNEKDNLMLIYYFVLFQHWDS